MGMSFVAKALITAPRDRDVACHVVMVCRHGKPQYLLGNMRVVLGAGSTRPLLPWNGVDLFEV
eukprot:3920911-Pyramimonas_sp.AAC.1